MLEAEGDSLRVALVARVGETMLLEGLRELQAPEELVEFAPLRASRALPSAVTLVTDAIAPGQEEGPERVVAPWRATLGSLGLELGSLWPLWGLPLANLAPLPRDPCLFLQVERQGITTIEIVAGRLRSVEHLPGAPTLERCLERVGPGAPEVLLAGRGLDLSQLGYEIARDGTTWVRILRARLELGAVLGARDLSSIGGVAWLHADTATSAGARGTAVEREHLASALHARTFPRV